MNYNLRQYRTIQVCGLRRQFFRQIGRNFRRNPAGFQENFGQYGGNKCKQGVRRELCGVALIPIGLSREENGEFLIEVYPQYRRAMEGLDEH